MWVDVQGPPPKNGETHKAIHASAIARPGLSSAPASAFVTGSGNSRRRRSECGRLGFQPTEGLSQLIKPIGIKTDSKACCDFLQIRSPAMVDIVPESSLTRGFDCGSPDLCVLSRQGKGVHIATMVLSSHRHRQDFLFGKGRTKHCQASGENSLGIIVEAF